MTVRSTMKSYAKVIQIAYEASASVDFKDSNNNAIDCNYFSVDCRSSDQEDAGYFIAQPSGVYGTQFGADGLTLANAASATGSHIAAGVGGVIGTADGSVEMSLNSNQKSPGIMLFNKLVGAGTGEADMAVFVITYGNMKQANPRRDEDDTFYPPGS